MTAASSSNGRAEDSDKTTTELGCRPAQIRLAVDDIEAAVAFYEQAFGLRCRRGDGGDEDQSRTMVFAEREEQTVFVLVLLSDEHDVDRPPSRGTIGLLVDDVDTAHQRALAAGGTELVAPHEPDERTRCSAVADPSHNWLWIDQ